MSEETDLPEVPELEPEVPEEEPETEPEVEHIGFLEYVYSHIVDMRIELQNGGSFKPLFVNP